MPSRPDFNRRDFLKTTATATAASAVAGVWSELSAEESVSPNEKLIVVTMTQHMPFKATAHEAAKRAARAEGYRVEELGQ